MKENSSINARDAVMYELSKVNFLQMLKIYAYKYPQTTASLFCLNKYALLISAN